MQSTDHYAEELAAFADALTELRVAQGKPPLAEIEQHAPSSRPLSKSALSEAFAGKRLPSIDFVVALVRTLLTMGDPEHSQVSSRDPRLEEWRARWKRVQLLQIQERRTQPLAGAAAFPDVDEVAPEALTLSAHNGMVRCFVAMPGTSMGESSDWSDIPSIKRRLLEPAVSLIGHRLTCEIELVIEKEKSATGLIHRSMFDEAMKADIYIVDLTGANPNVYLELGVRWAFSDGVTILICQHISEVRFNAAANRVIEYGPMPDALEEAIHRIANAAVDGLGARDRTDSPVREGSPLILVNREEYNSLREEVSQLRGRQAEELIEAARRTGDPYRKIALLKEAIGRSPTSWDAHFELGSASRKQGHLDDAELSLRASVQLKPEFAPAWRELGITLGKKKDYTDAIDAFDHALDLDAQDEETWANQGGLLRRISRKSPSGVFEPTLLERALACYRKASQIRKNWLYPLMNAARIELLLGCIHGEPAGPVIERIRELELLARFEDSNSKGSDPWVVLDLADTFLLTGRTEEGLQQLRRAASLCIPEERSAVLSTAAEPLQDFLDMGAGLAKDALEAISRALELCSELQAASQDADTQRLGDPGGGA